MENIEIQLPVSFFSAGQFVAYEGWAHPRRTLDSSVLFLLENGSFIIDRDFVEAHSLATVAYLVLKEVI